ncbi:MAG TPA: GNAT family N-acetyltransferase [Anaerolineae bacterium]|nr:GNAT family N-acetyltransferase [Anaerolineae bacterium]
MDGMIREARGEDGPAILAIYETGIATRNATFETAVPSWAEWDQRHHPHSRFVYEEEGQVLGWVALAPVSPRQVYRGVAEISIYLAPQARGTGVGTRLMQRAVASSEAHGMWTLHAALFPENKASVRLHEKCGFRRVGVRERIAQLDGEWRDTLVMERRSQVVGL